MRLPVRGVMPALSPLVFLAFGCAGGIPKAALVLNQTPIEGRRLETRRFVGIEDSKLVEGAARVLQDLGYKVEASDSKLGLVVGSKTRSAKGRRQNDPPVMGSLLGSRANPAEKEQLVRASITVSPQAEDKPGNQIVRITFQRIVWNVRNEVTAREGVVDPQVYFDFFAKLSKAVSLEARPI